MNLYALKHSANINETNYRRHIRHDGSARRRLNTMINKVNLMAMHGFCSLKTTIVLPF